MSCRTCSQLAKLFPKKRFKKDLQTSCLLFIKLREKNFHGRNAHSYTRIPVPKDENRAGAVISRMRRPRSFLVDRDGQPIAYHGDIGDMDTTSFSSLAAGNVAATSSMAKLIGEDVFPAVVHEGERESIFIRVIGRSLLVVVFDERSTLGLVKLRTKKRATKSPRFLKMSSVIRKNKESAKIHFSPKSPTTTLTACLVSHLSFVLSPLQISIC